MISLKRFSGRKGEPATEAKGDASPPLKPARDVWGILVEPMQVNRETIYALSFHRKGTSIYYLYRHFRARAEADDEFLRLTQDLGLGQSEFEMKYALDLLS